MLGAAKTGEGMLKEVPISIPSYRISSLEHSLFLRLILLKRLAGNTGPPHRPDIALSIAGHDWLPCGLEFFLLVIAKNEPLSALPPLPECGMKVALNQLGKMR